jgi:hypothetical protein
MTAQGTFPIVQIIALFVTNIIGIALVGLIIISFRIIHEIPNKKLILSIGVGFITQGILLVALLDVGILLWMDSGNFPAVFSVLPFSLCLIPILLPVTAIGTYIQLTYREKIQDYINSKLRNRSS